VAAVAVVQLVKEQLQPQLWQAQAAQAQTLILLGVSQHQPDNL
jgi:hypothetical protein